MSEKRLCLVGSDIVLSDVRIHEGDVSGWVDNGNWYYYEKGGQYHCFHDYNFRWPVTSWPLKARHAVIVDRRGDYNDVLRDSKSKPNAFDEACILFKGKHKRDTDD